MPNKQDVQRVSVVLQLSLQQTARYPRLALPVSCPKMGQSIPGSQQHGLFLACSQPVHLQPAGTCNQSGAVGQADMGLL